jgi:hypothetical protein
MRDGDRANKNEIAASFFGVATNDFSHGSCSLSTMIRFCGVIGPIGDLS